MFKFAVNALLSTLSIAYPLLWLVQPESSKLAYFPTALALLWAIKSRFSTGLHHYFAIVFALVLLLAGIARFKQGLDLMYWYPVAVNLLMFTLFSASLWTKQSAIERLARLKTPDLPPAAIIYTRRVTQLWCAFFLFNIVLVSYLIIANHLQLWAIYTGIVAYVLMALLFVGEWIVRPK